MRERNAVNPVSWSAGRGFNQGEVVSGHSRTLYISGQTAMSEDGKPEHDGDMTARLALGVDNVEAVLAGAGMSLANLVRLNVHTTDVDLLVQHYGVLAGRPGAAGRRTDHHHARRDPPGDPRADGRARRHRGRVAPPGTDPSSAHDGGGPAAHRPPPEESLRSGGAPPAAAR
ncbi:hypothetical protein SUDANB146_06201 [Streptomyces sp. enrichment culture]